MPTILLVEDERSLSSVLGFELKKSNFDVEFAYDGEEALEKLEKIKPDLILLDLILPKINGFDVLEKIKQNFNTRSIPVIVLSNLGSDDDIKRAIKLGASDYYVKAQHPLLEIVEKISKFLEIPRSPIETSKVLAEETPLIKQEPPTVERVERAEIVPEVKKEEKKEEKVAKKAVTEETKEAKEALKIEKEAIEETVGEGEDKDDQKIKLPKGVRKFIREKKKEIKETISDPKERHKKIIELYEEFSHKKDGQV